MFSTLRIHALLKHPLRDHGLGVRCTKFLSFESLAGNQLEFGATRGRMPEAVGLQVGLGRAIRCPSRRQGVDRLHAEVVPLRGQARAADLAGAVGVPLMRSRALGT